MASSSQVHMNRTDDANAVQKQQQSRHALNQQNRQYERDTKV